MSETAYFINDLIQISRTGTDFYEEAAKSVSDKKLSRVFTDMAKAKLALADNLTSELKPEHKQPAQSIELVEEVDQTYAEVRGGFKAVNSANITALELTESHIQVSLQKVVMDRDNSFVIRVLAKQYVHASENLKAELRSRKRALA
jgi:uncharacterized protein (TIGR02284 family)